jgi:hypothetical protein
MQAITFRYSLPHFAFAQVLGLVTPRSYARIGAPTQLEQIPEPTQLGDAWTIVRLGRYGMQRAGIA